jgi:hypothetical protein
MGETGLAHLGGESSKLLFKVLAEWNHALSHTSIAIDTPPANGNAPSAKFKSSKPQPKKSPSDNIIDVDLSTRRKPWLGDRSRKVTSGDDDGMEVGHG